MQAVKPQSSSTKCHSSSTSNNNALTSATNVSIANSPSSQMESLTNKSIAQRVMDVTGPETSHPPTTKTTSMSSSSISLGSPAILSSNEPLTPSSFSNGPNSFNSLSMVMASTSVESSEPIFRHIVAESNSKSEDPLIPETQSTATASATTTATNNSLESVTSSNHNLDLASGFKTEKDLRISLETEVPLPLYSDFHKQETPAPKGLTIEHEEVSYYNDQTTANLMHEAELIRQNKYRQPDSPSNTRTNGTITKDSTNGTRLSVTVNDVNSVQVRDSHKGSEYINDILDDYDYYARYDNAQVDDINSKENQDIMEQARQHCYYPEPMSLPSSPKAKSAPATPCNVTPTAFHQNTSHMNSMLHPSPANTLPPDIRMNISTCRVLPSSMGASSSQPNRMERVHVQYLDKLFKKGQTEMASSDYSNAILSFSKCIDMASRTNFKYLEQNFKIYGQRAKAHFELGNYNEAIEDSMAARGLNPKWTQAYYLQGQAQFRKGEHAAALAAFSYGLTQDPNDKQLFEALVDSALNSTFKQDFEPKYKRLKSLNMHWKPFVVVSVLGQELLANNHSPHATVILESALKLGPENKKFRGSVLSSIGCAYYRMNEYEKAIVNMQKELELESELEDVAGQCRVLSNLGYIFYKMRKYDKSLESHRKQLTLAMRTHEFKQASIALNATGHVHVARNDFTSALTSHTRCLEILRQLGKNEFAQFRELLSIGHVNSMLNDFKAAHDRYSEAIQLIETSNEQRTISQEEYHMGLIMVNFNYAYLALKRQSFSDAKYHYKIVSELAERIPYPKSALVEMRAANGMGQTYRLFKKFDEAGKSFHKQYQLAKQVKDQVGQSQALCNLGMISQHFKDYNRAWELFDTNLRLVAKDPLLEAYAHSYMGSMYFLQGRYTEAQSHYEISKNIFTGLDYCSAEKKTIDLNMAAVNERIANHNDI